MLRKYLSFLRTLIQGIFNGESTVTFSDYLEALWLTFILILNVVLVIVLGYVVLFLPRFAYIKLLKFYDSQLELLASNNDNTVRSAEDKLKATSLLGQRKRAIQIYWVAFVLVYIPFMMPTVLFLFDVVTSMF